MQQGRRWFRQSSFVCCRKKQGNLIKEIVKKILIASKPAPVDLRLHSDQIQKFFPEGCTTEQMIDTILNLLEKWSDKEGATVEHGHP